MKLITKNLTSYEAKLISKWKYEGEYEIYNLPTWDDMVKQQCNLCVESKRERFRAYVNEDNEVVGYVSLVDKGDCVLFGIGINPMYCNNGIGKQVTRLALDECEIKYPEKPVVLEVRSWNKRAISCYKSQGFGIIDRKEKETYLGLGEFYVMRYI